MEDRQLGTNGPWIPPLMLGAWPIGGGLGAVDEALAIRTVQRAVDLGIRAIDTAEYYRTSESVIGKALAGRPRDSYFLATKVSRGPFTRERVAEALDHSLRALQTDHVDLYQLHNYPTGVPLEEALEALAAARESGKARYVGVSNFTIEQLRVAQSIRPIQSLQPRLNALQREVARDLLPFCQQQGIGVIVYSPLATGLLTGRYRPGHQFAPDDERSRSPRFQGETFARALAVADELAEVAREKGVTLVHLAISWTLAQPGVTAAIVGAKTPEQVEEHRPAADLRLTTADLARIDVIAAKAPDL